MDTRLYAQNNFSSYISVHFSVEVPTCPHEYAFSRGHSCYHISMEKATWAEAQAQCKTMRSNLVTIETRGEQEFLVSTFKTSQGSFHYCQFNCIRQVHQQHPSPLAHVYVLGVIPFPHLFLLWKFPAYIFTLIFFLNRTPAMILCGKPHPHPLETSYIFAYVYTCAWIVCIESQRESF